MKLQKKKKKIEQVIIIIVIHERNDCAHDLALARTIASMQIVKLLYIYVCHSVP